MLLSAVKCCLLFSAVKCCLLQDAALCCLLLLLSAYFDFKKPAFHNLLIHSQTAPYGMLKETPLTMTGNDRYEGFGIELIQKLSERLGFNYTFVVQEDGAYGSLIKETGEWNGMLREIMDGRADLAITDLTITSERESATDFTMPFMVRILNDLQF